MSRGPFRILVVNPGSTSTKIALFEDEAQRDSASLAHPADALSRFIRIADQLPFRLGAVESFMAERDIRPASLDAVVGRGGLLRPMEGGTYAVDDRMAEDLRTAAEGEHASNLGGLIARVIADQAGISAYIVDPVVVDEMDEVARLTGLPEFRRRSIFHALNQKAVAREAGRRLNRPVQSLRLIVAHLGGGISVGAHREGRVVDVNNALDGDGPFSPERSGGLPSGQLADWCCSGKASLSEIRRKLTGHGGMVAHLGTNDLVEVERRIAAGDRTAALVRDAMAYQTAKQIGAMAAVLEGRVDALVLTGGLAASAVFTEAVLARVRWIAPVFVLPGEKEMESLAQGGLRILRGEETPGSYAASGD
ncbi:butyrate kinase [bacterium]|nr:butyrate kinase [bacterium]